MKVLQINAVSGIRSTGRISVEMADFLNSNGHEGYIAYSEGIPYKKGYKIGTSTEIKLHGLFSRLFGKQAYFSKNGTRELLNYIENLKPDIVHLGNLHANYINLKILLEYLANKDIPTVITLHDCWFYTGKCMHYTIDECNKWETGCGGCPRLKKDNPSWLFDRSKEMYQNKKELFKKIPRLAVVGVSDWITNEAKKSFLSSAKIITRIYNWVDLEVFQPVNTVKLRRKLGIEDKFIILGVASNWSNSKGLGNFLKLSNSVSEDTVIVLIGNLKTDVKIPENILHIKETHNVNDLVSYYSMADIFLNLSLEETFGKVTAEALACGTPAIVINSTANPELIGNGCGYVVEKNNTNQLLECIEKIKKNGKSYYSYNCIKFAKDNFLKNNLLNEFLDLYRSLKGDI